MGKNLVQKILGAHLLSEPARAGETIAIAIDQTLVQDTTGTMAALEFEALSRPRVKTKLSVAYIDHNTLQIGFENADDHLFLQSFCAKYGLHFSRPGNGICHQVHLERFAVPGQTLLGADSHTPTSGAMGMFAVGVGGLDVALAMAGEPLYIPMPRVVRVNLSGQLPDWVSAKDVILALLRRSTVKGGIGTVWEYAGPGVRTLTVPERATIANMGAESGATTSLFPSDELTRVFLKAQQREKDWIPLEADPDAYYDEVVEMDLRSLEPLVAEPHSPDRVCPVKEIAGLPVDQIVIGSCTNSSLKDLMTVAAILKGKTVPPRVSVVLSPGSRQVLQMLSRSGALSDLIAAGVRILESACGPCIGMGQAPSTGGVSLRTINRNFQGRSGTQSGLVYLGSPEVAAASALTGTITDPRSLGDPPAIDLPEVYAVSDSMVLSPPPPDRAAEVNLIRGPNIQPLPCKGRQPERLAGRVLLKLGDHISTDDILPGGPQVLALRSNIPAISEYVFAHVDPSFVRRAKEWGGGFLVAGINYGQGSSREHAVIGPMFLGVQAVVAKSFARIHRANLINFGIVPFTFQEEGHYEAVRSGDELEIEVGDFGGPLFLVNRTQAMKIPLVLSVSARERVLLKQGGALSYVRGKAF